ncbi:AAA family ATPase [Endozoicomonas elysicola]|uniref:Kinase n=1 Tax=Endozoicomonas elysicola TaxID=305900 RepID=A0A081KDK8_9GAMM|nr:AAA family ATPase [Endozoicomonas elysicola]KEI72234.1 kinase [Endozoicomonas elysicola]
MGIPTLYIFSGLPASGKSTLAQLLSRHLRAMYVRIDTIEQGLRDLCSLKVEGEGYRLSYRIVQDNLKLGISVVSDSCNPIKLTRDEWQETAIQTTANFINIEIHCSDTVAHQQRAKSRSCSVTNLKLPDWNSIQHRQYAPWDREVIRIDTANKSIEQSFSELIEKLAL